MQNKKVLVFLHGFGLNKDFWGKLPGKFSGNYRIIIPDIPGFGESGKQENRDYDIASQEERFNRFLSFLKINSISLIGFSMGGAISCAYCVSNPGKVERLVLLDSYGAATIESECQKYFQKTGTNLLLFRTLKEYKQLLTYVVYKPQELPGQFLKYFSDFNIRNYELNKKLYNDLVKNGNDILIKDLPKIDSPVLIIWGKEDKLIDPAAASNFHKGLKNSKVVIIEQASHMVYADKEDEVISSIYNF